MANLKALLRQAEAVDVPDLEELISYCKRTLLFKKVRDTNYYLSAKAQAKMLALCQHHLDDLTEKKVGLYQAQSVLERLLAEAERILYKKYEEKLSKMRVADQKVFIEAKTVPIRQRLAKVKRALKIIDTFMENLTQTHWTLTKLQTATDTLLRMEKGG